VSRDCSQCTVQVAERGLGVRVLDLGTTQDIVLYSMGRQQLPIANGHVCLFTNMLA